jgi:hypothetical protein
VNYTVTFTDFPAGVADGALVDAMLDNAVRSMGSAPGWEIRNQERIVLDGKHPGRDVTFEIRSPDVPEAGRGRARLYVIGPRLYQVIAVGPRSKVTEEELLAFQNSFELTSDVKPLADAPAPTAASIGSPVAAGSPAGHLEPEEVRTTGPIAADSAATPPGAPPSSAGGVEIIEFRWMDAESDMIGATDHPEPDQQPDEHFRLAWRLPPGAEVKELIITNEGPNQWQTVADGFHWPLGVFRDGQPIARAHVPKVGIVEGDVVFDIYANSPGGIREQSPFDLKAVVAVDGVEHTLGAHTQRN